MPLPALPTTRYSELLKTSEHHQLSQFRSCRVRCRGRSRASLTAPPALNCQRAVAEIAENDIAGTGPGRLGTINRYSSARAGVGAHSAVVTLYITAVLDCHRACAAIADKETTRTGQRRTLTINHHCPGRAENRDRERSRRWSPRRRSGSSVCRCRTFAYGKDTDAAGPGRLGRTSTVTVPLEPVASPSVPLLFSFPPFLIVRSPVPERPT